MAREYNHGNKQGLKPLPISISSPWDACVEIFRPIYYTHFSESVLKFYDERSESVGVRRRNSMQSALLFSSKLCMTEQESGDFVTRTPGSGRLARVPAREAPDVKMKRHKNRRA